jgi:hypothetical protein
MHYIGVCAITIAKPNANPINVQMTQQKDLPCCKVEVKGRYPELATAFLNLIHHHGTETYLSHMGAETDNRRTIWSQGEGK